MKTNKLVMQITPFALFFR